MDTGREETNSQASISSAAVSSASEPRHRLTPRFRTVMKKFLPKFEPEKSTVKPKPTSFNTVETTSFTSPLKSNTQTLPSNFAFTWPDNPAISQHSTSGLYTVPEGSPTQLTSSSVGMETVHEPISPMTGSNDRFGILQTQNSAEPRTASTGISSRSSTYGDVPSRIPRFQKGYSPMG